MRTSWRIFGLSGIEIRIDSSWIFIFALITWALAGHYFPSHYPGRHDFLGHSFYALSQRP